MAFRSKLRLLNSIRKRCWKRCKKLVTKSKHSFEQNTSPSTIYGTTHSSFRAFDLVNDNINVQSNELNQSLEDSHTSFHTDLEQAWSSLNKAECNLTNSEKEKSQRESRLARTRNSLTNSSLTKSQREKLQILAKRQQRLVQQSEKNINMEQEMWQLENEHFSNVMSIMLNTTKNGTES